MLVAVECEYDFGGEFNSGRGDVFEVNASDLDQAKEKIIKYLYKNCSFEEISRDELEEFLWVDIYHPRKA